MLRRRSIHFGRLFYFWGIQLFGCRSAAVASDDFSFSGRLAGDLVYGRASRPFLLSPAAHVNPLNNYLSRGFLHDAPVEETCDPVGDLTKHLHASS